MRWTIETTTTYLVAADRTDIPNWPLDPRGYPKIGSKFDNIQKIISPSDFPYENIYLCKIWLQKTYLEYFYPFDLHYCHLDP